MKYLIGGIDLFCAACLWILYTRDSFYRAYFHQKQRNLGQNPYDTLREQFPWLWRFM